MSKDSKSPLTQRKPSNDKVTTSSTSPFKNEQEQEKGKTINHPNNKQSPTLEQSYSSSLSPKFTNVTTAEPMNNSAHSSIQTNNLETTTRILVSNRTGDQDKIPEQQKPILTPIRSLFQFHDNASLGPSSTLHSDLLELSSLSKSLIPAKETERDTEEIIERSRSTKPNKRRSIEIISEHSVLMVPPVSLKRSRSLSPSSMEGRALQLPPILTKALSVDESFERLDSSKLPFTTHNRSSLSVSGVPSPRTLAYSPFKEAAHETQNNILETEEEQNESFSKRTLPILTRSKSSTGGASTLYSDVNTNMKKEQEFSIAPTFPDTSAIIDDAEIQKLSSERKLYKFKEYIPKIDVYQHEPENEQEEREYNKGPWTKEEHELFIKGFKECGRQWKMISDHYVKTRDRRQVSSHAQKHIKKLSGSTLHKAESTPQALTSTSQEPNIKLHKEDDQEIPDNRKS
jgi:SHAQKYF class myb-like DNA-binding protein